MALDRTQVPNDLNAFWMPFTANRQFKAAPRMLYRADGMHYTNAEGRQVLDGIAGLWCCNAGHARERIVEAIRTQAGSSTTPRPSRWATRRRSRWPTG